MTRYKKAELPHSEKGNDPNDHREDATYLIEVSASGVVSIKSLAWTQDFTITKEEAEMIAAPEWIFRNLIINGHVVAIPAPPNGGKTTIMLWIASEIAQEHDVYYVNADVSGGDAKAMILNAESAGFHLLLPDMKVGLSMEDVVKNLERMAESNATFNGTVFIFDTLKKMTDVISKSASRKLYKLLRQLSAKGMTIVLLAHTNKYNDADGQPIYEGTGDLRADVDDLIYMVPLKNDDGSMTVSTTPDKTRGQFSPITFHIAPDRQVSLSSDYVDTVAQQRAEAAYRDDMPYIEVILGAITSGAIKQSEIVQYAKERRIGQRVCMRVLRVYSKGPYQQWTAKKGLQRNVIQYFAGK